LATGAPAFLGRFVAAGPVVYVSEEDSATVRAKLPPDGSPVRVLTRGHAYPRPSWAELIDAAVAEAQRVGARLLVIDTLAFRSDPRADEEKDAGAATATMAALVGAANAGLAVLLVHHQRKAGGEEGDAVRGSSAIGAAADAILELERVPDAPPNQRRLVALARWAAPGMLLVDRDAASSSWRVLGEGGERGEAESLAWRDRLLRGLPEQEPGATHDDLEELLGADRRKWRSALEELRAEGVVTRSGEGKKGRPFRYRRRAEEFRPEFRPRAWTEWLPDSIPSPYGGGRNLGIRPGAAGRKGPDHRSPAPRTAARPVGAGSTPRAARPRGGRSSGRRSTARTSQVPRSSAAKRTN
jgi:hypothetical protein